MMLISRALATRIAFASPAYPTGLTTASRCCSLPASAAAASPATHATASTRPKPLPVPPVTSPESGSSETAVAASPAPKKPIAYKLSRTAAAARAAAAAAAAARVGAIKPKTPSQAKSTVAGPQLKSCADEAPAAERPLTALQKRELRMRDKAAFKLTQRAVDRIAMLLSNQNDDRQGRAIQETHAVGIRIGVKRRGCSGYSYTVNYAFEVDPRSRPGDVHVCSHGVSVYVEQSALFYVIGTEMDFQTSEVEAKFVFKNPNEKDACGCGESFMPFDV